MAKGPSESSDVVVETDDDADQGAGVLVPAVSRTVRVLDHLVRHADSATVTELAKIVWAGQEHGVEPYLDDGQ